MKLAGFSALVAIAPLGACGGAAVQEPRAAVAATARPGVEAAQEIVFGHFTAPVPAGFQAAPPQHEPMALMRHEASLIFLAEGMRFPDEPAKCQELVQQATTRLVSRAAGEQVELSVRGVGTLEAGEDAPGGCWMVATGKAADGQMGYLSTALHFGPADVFVMCMSPETSDTDACQWVIAGVHESAAAR